MLIVDTAGRLAIDEAMMKEIARAARGGEADRDAVRRRRDAGPGRGQHRASAFRDALPLTGVILTKLDGDARGGAALSVRHVTGAPIKFAGVSEKIDGLEVFHPERMASRILGMGDVLSLVEEAQKTVDVEEAKKLAKKVKSGKGFDLEDYKRADRADAQDGRARGMLDKLPAELARAAQGAHGRRAQDRARRGHHQVDDARRSARSRRSSRRRASAASPPAPGVRCRRSTSS